MQKKPQYFDFLINPSFQGMNRLFVLSFENENHERSYKRYYILTVEIKDYTAMMGESKFFDQPVKNYLRTFKNLQVVKMMIKQLGVYFKKHYMFPAISLSKQHKLDADQKAIQKINFIENVRRDGNNFFPHFSMFSKRNHFRFLTGNCGSIAILFCFHIISI